MKQRNIGASVRNRLLARARDTLQDFDLILTRYALERLLPLLTDYFLLKRSASAGNTTRFNRVEENRPPSTVTAIGP